MDVVTAFLNPLLQEEVYMEQPEGFAFLSANWGKLICQLRKSLYSLKQVPLAWYKDVDAYLGSLGLICS
jgi:Reverse transcriptase (RNA-dependent DNA polymerase)